MRRASTRLALLGLAVATLALPAAAGAAPAVTFKVKAVPIPKNPSATSGPTWPGTGNIFGAGTDVEAEFTISGTEYGGFPSPLTGVTFYTPPGSKLSTKGFTTCPAAMLESHEVQKCPKKSFAGPKGSAKGVVSFGGTRVHETLTVQPFFESGGDLAFYRRRTRTRLSIELLTTGKFSTPAGGFGPVFNGGSSARADGARCSLWIGGTDQGQGRRRLHEGQKARLLRHASQEVRQGRRSRSRPN